MEVPTSAPYQTTGQPDARLRAPEHVIDLILGVMRQQPRPDGPRPGTIDYARAVRAEARVYADRIWAEAYTTGAAWGLARNTQPILVAPDVYDRLTVEAQT